MKKQRREYGRKIMRRGIACAMAFQMALACGAPALAAEESVMEAGLATYYMEKYRFSEFTMRGKIELNVKKSMTFVGDSPNEELSEPNFFMFQAGEEGLYQVTFQGPGFTDGCIGLYRVTADGTSIYSKKKSAVWASEKKGVTATFKAGSGERVYFNAGQWGPETMTLQAEAKKVTVGSELTDSAGKNVYRIIRGGAKGGEVAFAGPLKKNYSYSAPKKIKLPSVLKLGGYTYKVTAIDAGACKKQKELKTVVIQDNVSKIGKEAFKNCKNLKRVIIQSKKLTKKGVNRQAFAGMPDNVKIQVPKKKLNAYTKLLKRCGLSDTATVEGI